jgi:hypothetical protein
LLLGILEHRLGKQIPFRQETEDKRYTDQFHSEFHEETSNLSLPEMLSPSIAEVLNERKFDPVS